MIILCIIATSSSSMLIRSLSEPNPIVYCHESQLCVNTTLSTFPRPLKWSYSHSLIRPFNWTTAILPVYNNQGGNQYTEWGLSNSTMNFGILKMLHLHSFLPSIWFKMFNIFSWNNINEVSSSVQKCVFLLKHAPCWDLCLTRLPTSSSGCVSPNFWEIQLSTINTIVPLCPTSFERGECDWLISFSEADDCFFRGKEAGHVSDIPDMNKVIHLHFLWSCGTNFKILMSFSCIISPQNSPLMQLYKQGALNYVLTGQR